jgi:hypothetical protein
LDVELVGVYTFLLCLDEMTADNGAILFWPGSEKCESNPNKGIQQRDSESDSLPADQTMGQNTSRGVVLPPTVYNTGVL